MSLLRWTCCPVRSIWLWTLSGFCRNKAGLMMCRYVRSVARLSSVFTITYQYTPGELPIAERETNARNYRSLNSPLRLGTKEKCQDSEPWHFSLEGQERLELSTPCLRGRCSNQLSYWPVMLCKKYVLNVRREPPSSLASAPGA